MGGWIVSIERRVAWIDAGIAGIFALAFFWTMHAAKEAAADAVRRYGHNVDSGAIANAAAVIYFAPVALTFALASCALFCHWRIRWFAHWLAVAAAVLPPVFSLLTAWLR